MSTGHPVRLFTVAFVVIFILALMFLCCGAFFHPESRFSNRARFGVFDMLAQVLKTQRLPADLAVGSFDAGSGGYINVVSEGLARIKRLAVRPAMQLSVSLLAALVVF